MKKGYSILYSVLGLIATIWIGAMILFVMYIVACFLEFTKPIRETKTGLESGNYDLSAEVIYLKEGYTPKYTYQFEREVYYTYRSGFITSWGKTELSNTMLRTDGVLEEPVFYKENALQKEVCSYLSWEEKREIKKAIWEIETIKLENASYYLLEGQDKTENGLYQIRIYKITSDSEVISTIFELDTDVMWDCGVERFAMYKGNRLCAYDSLWFDENLERISLPAIEEEEYLWEDEYVQTLMINSDNEIMKELGEGNGYSLIRGRCGDVYYYFWWIPHEKYLTEFDLQGEVLSIRKINGDMSFGNLEKITPKLYDADDDKYYDVIR